MPFDQTQVRALSGKLSARHVRTRQAQGRTLSYIEGWHAISEANRIFGHDAWDRQTLINRCVWQGQLQGRAACAYVARVRVKVRAGETVICREGCGTGRGSGPTPGEAHESALKEAETDATKRALMTFGNPFGLALYDREQKGVRGTAKAKAPRAISWVLLSPEGEALAVHADPVAFCTALRREIEGLSDPERLAALWARNLATLEMLLVNLPDLTTDKGEHYGAILRALYHRRLRELKEAQSQHQAATPERQATAAPPHAGEPHRRRDRAASRAVPCRQEGQAAAETPQGMRPPSEPARAKTTTAATPQTPRPQQEEDQAGAQGPRVGEPPQPLDRAASGTSQAPEPPAGPARVDKAALAIDAPRRIRDKEHLKFVRDQPCLVCGRAPSQAHHLRFTQPRALSRKVSDEWVVPLCALHHQSLHTVGDERTWWKHQGIDPVAKAERFWADTAGRL